MSHPPPAKAGGHARNRPTVAHWLILLLVTFFVGPMYASNLWGYLQSRRYLTDAAFVNIRNVAALEASETREFVRSAEGLISSIVAGNHYLFQVVRLLQDSDEDRGVLSHALHSHLAAKAGEGRSFREFLVLSPSGRLLASSEPGWVLDSDLSNHRCYEAGFSGISVAGFDYPESADSAEHDHSQHGQPQHEQAQREQPQHDHSQHDHSEPSPALEPSGSAESEPAHAAADAGASDHVPQLLVAGPIRQEDGKMLGVFCGRFSFDVHRGLMIATRERTQQATLYLLNERGEIVCGSFDEIHGAPYGETLAWLERGGPRPSGAWEGKYRAADGSEVMAAFSPVPALGWGVVVEVPVVRALADLERLRWQAGVGSGMLACVLALAAFLSWRTFVRPLQELSRASERMSSGTPGETVAPGGPREIADLASAFNRMSLALQESQEDLEARIAKRTEALRESREFLELLLDSIDQRVVVVDRNFEIVKENAAAVRMHGRSLVGERCSEVFEGAADLPDNHPICRTFETGEGASDERSQQTVRGREAVYVETYPVFDADGRVDSVVEIGRVVTAEKQLQMQMVYQEKMAAFGQLAAGVAHEIGNPLAAIESQLRLAQHDPQRVDQTLEVVHKQVGRMNRMLRRLVNFTRRKRDEVMLASANQVVDDVAQLLEHDPRARRVSIETRLAQQVPGIRAKEDDLVQVLLNLGLNALDAIDDEGTVRFETAVEGGHVVVRVRDTGSGVAEDARNSLFDPFFTTKGPGRGTGLGLFVSKSIIDGIGGQLELEHPGPGGTTFVVRLPIAGEGVNGAGI